MLIDYASLRDVLDQAPKDDDPVTVTISDAMRLSGLSRATINRLISGHGAPHENNAHTAIVTDPSALKAARAAIEQRPLPCRSLMSTLVGEVVATAVLTGEHRLGRIGAVAIGAGSP